MGKQAGWDVCSGRAKAQGTGDLALKCPFAHLTSPAHLLAPWRTQRRDRALPVSAETDEIRDLAPTAHTSARTLHPGRQCVYVLFHIHSLTSTLSSPTPITCM